MLHGRQDPHPGQRIRKGVMPYLPQLEYCEWDACGHYPGLKPGPPIPSHSREPQIQTCSIRGASHETGAPEAMAEETPCRHVGIGISTGQGIPWVICLSE